MKMIEPKQIQLLHIQKAQLGLSDDEYRDAIAGQTKGKKRSSKGLTYFEADGLITYFSKLGAKIQSNYIRTSGAARRARWQYANSNRKSVRPAQAGNVVMMPSRDQLEMIDVLTKKIAWRFEDGYERWLKRYMKIKRIVTAQQASDTIEGLKGLLKNQKSLES